MLYRQCPRGLRLGIDLEAESLMSYSAGEAYWIARRRAEEASSEQLAQDWSGVADTIARKTGRRARSILAAMFPE
jgi:hypothetical protein